MYIKGMLIVLHSRQVFHDKSEYDEFYLSIARGNIQEIFYDN